MTTKSTGVFDCDTHIYEPRDAMTRYLPRSISTVRSDQFTTPMAKTW